MVWGGGCRLGASSAPGLADLGSPGTPRKEGGWVFLAAGQAFGCCPVVRGEVLEKQHPPLPLPPLHQTGLNQDLALLPLAGGGRSKARIDIARGWRGAHANTENPLAGQKKNLIPARFWLGGPSPVLGARIIFHVISRDRSLSCFCPRCVPLFSGGVPGGWGAAPGLPPYLAGTALPLATCPGGGTLPPSRICGAGW